MLAAAHADPDFGAAYRARFVEPRRDQARAVLGRARARGELAPGGDVEVAVDMLWGPLYHRLLHGHGRLDDRFAKRVVDLVVAGVTQQSG